MPTPAVEMRGVSKRFGALQANRGVDFTLQAGEIHALLGENGAGKSTLMRILYGLYRADEGEILIHGQAAAIRSPKDAIAHGIGMVTQHFALVTRFSVAENVILGYDKAIRLNLNEANRSVAAAGARFGLPLDPQTLVKDLSVGQRQRVEILKALYRDARILILDEPTAVLSPQETEQLFASLRQLQQHGLSVVFISHKLWEVMSITDRVTVLRGGEVVGSATTAAVSQSDLARMMVGRPTFGVVKAPTELSERQALKIEALAADDNKGLPALKGVSLQVNAGEILGLAGVSGNGQTELAQVLEGTRPCTAGRVTVYAQDITNASPEQIMQAGVGRIPEDRHESVVGEMSVAQNMALEHLGEFTRRRLLDKGRMRRHAERLIADYQIKARPDDRIRTLSGGNMQKVILARVLERDPRLIIVAQPTRGLDVGATEFVRGKLIEQRGKGAAILLISEDLDEILELADRIAVIYEGQITGVVPRAEATPERLGLLMAGARE